LQVAEKKDPPGTRARDPMQHQIFLAIYVAASRKKIKWGFRLRSGFRASKYFHKALWLSMRNPSTHNRVVRSNCIPTRSCGLFFFGLIDAIFLKLLCARPLPH
jgi:hypothetical protein